MSEEKTYIDFVKWRAQWNPCLQPQADRLMLKDVTLPKAQVPVIYSIDLGNNSNNELQPSRMRLDDLLVDLRDFTQRADASVTLRRVILVENIDKVTIQALGSFLDIDPVFFAHYLLTDLGAIEHQPTPPSLAMLPSAITEKTSVHLHYQQLLSLGNVDMGDPKTYKFEKLCNVKRQVRCPPALSGIQPAIMRGCCSAILKQFGHNWVYLILVDSSSTDSIPNRASTIPSIMPPSPRKLTPLQGGIEDFARAASFAEFAASPRQPLPPKSSMLQTLLWYYKERPPGLDVDNPNLLLMAYYPIKVVSSHWMLYVLLLNRYYRFYEYSVNKQAVETSLESELVDLQRWRRRARQSISKLRNVTTFISLHSSSVSSSGPRNECLSEICAGLLEDYRHIVNEIEDYNKGLEFLITIRTAMVQVSVARQSILEASNVRRLTYVALLFAPLGLVATLFSMADVFLPGNPKFWIYLVTAILALLVVLGVAFATDSSTRSGLQKWFKIKWRHTFGPQSTAKKDMNHV
ncbi:hypothetical protein BJ170DRAFT_229075 [Xylariales sp. AK1849]|nr:hypothetical protein BJ170DRAFT_229075 [Xylariales sp. AK1849]